MEETPPTTKGVINMKYVIRGREAGNKMGLFDTLEEARKVLAEFEEEDRKDGVYVADFYEIYDRENEEIVY